MHSSSYVKEGNAIKKYFRTFTSKGYFMICSGPVLESKGMRAIFQKNGKESIKKKLRKDKEG